MTSRSFTPATLQVGIFFAIVLTGCTSESDGTSTSSVGLPIDVNAAGSIINESEVIDDPQLRLLIDEIERYHRIHGAVGVPMQVPMQREGMNMETHEVPSEE